MSLKIIPMCEQHLAGAGALLAASYRTLRETVPSLSPAYEQADAFLPPLRKLIGGSPGVVALRDGQVAGFMAGIVIPEFMGKRAAYSPEWAHAAPGTDSRLLYEEMYAYLSAQWVADGCHLHAFTLMASAAEAISALQWSGFGLVNVDAVRDLTPVEGGTATVNIRQATMSDLGTVTELAQALIHHIAAPPVFWPQRARDYSEWLTQPGSAVWLACDGDHPLGMVGVRPDNPDGLLVLADVKTVHIRAAFTAAPARGSGITTALLNHALQWARASGYERCHVDFETANRVAARFWLKRFQPVAYSLVRWIPD